MGMNFPSQLHVFRFKVNAFIVLYRSALTGALYAKTLRLTSMAARELGQVRSFFPVAARCTCTDVASGRCDDVYGGGC
jgi:hypothetical protein